MASFEKGLSKIVLDSTVSLTADSLYYTTGPNTRVSVRTALDSLLLRVEALESAAAGEKYIFLDGNSEATFASGADFLLNFSYSWCLGIDIVEIDPTWAADNA